MNAITTPSQFGQLSTKFAAQPVDNELGAGIQAGFGIIGYKGKVWSTRYRGEKRDLMRPDGDGPRNSIEVVILKASQHVSKIFYENGYEEGSSSPPDCFSSNGVTPDPGSTKKQSATCAACPMNAWGSRITPQGKQGKRCSDSKRVAVVPREDLRNEILGGPMLLRVPAASLKDLALYGERLQQWGYPYYAVSTRIGFDPAEAFQKFVFNPIAPLTDAEADIVLEHRNSPTVSRILAEGAEHRSESATPPAPLVFEQPAPAAAPAPAPAVSPAPSPAPTPASALAAAAAPEPEANASTGADDFDKALEALMAS